MVSKHDFRENAVACPVTFGENAVACPVPVSCFPCLQTENEFNQSWVTAEAKLFLLEFRLKEVLWMPLT